MLSDDGSGFIAKPFNEYLSAMGIPHIFALRNPSQIDGKIERLNLTAKEKLLLIVYTSPDEFGWALEAFLHGYNFEHYHEEIGNLHPADVYHGRAEAILAWRKPLKELIPKARRKANLTNANNPRKKRHLRAKTL